MEFNHKMIKLISTSKGLKLANSSSPNIGNDDLMIKVFSSCYSKGTESATWENHQKSVLRKAIQHKDKIKKLIVSKDFSAIKEKYRSQLDSVIPLGYSLCGEVVSKGRDVSSVSIGDMVVAVGSSANHSEEVVVPQGLCMSISKDNDPLDASVSAIGAIALNGIRLSNTGIGGKSLVIGCGLIGQLAIQMLSKSGVEVTGVDIEEDKLLLSIKHGATYTHLSVNNQIEKKIDNDYFDSIFIVTPFLDVKMWEVIGDCAKYSANIVLLGAADLNCPRKVFYNKKLKFITSHSYGPGRGRYDYEVLGEDFPDISNTWDIKKNIHTFLDLTKKGDVTTKFIDNIKVQDKTESELVHALVESDNYSVIIDWRKEEKGDTGVNSINTSVEALGSFACTNHVGVIGFSAFAKESHIPSINKTEELTLSNISNRSPVGSVKGLKFVDLDKILTDKTIGTIVVSTGHKSHADNIINVVSHEKIAIVDKPLCISKIEHEKLKKHRIDGSIFMCFMSRRYSNHTKYIKKVILESKKPVHMDLSFRAPRKDIKDKIYYEGGRIVGEMCHHIDLACYLLGYPNSVTAVCNDNNLVPQKRENMVLLLEFSDGSTANIRYSTIGDDLGYKEFLRFDVDHETYEIINFKTLTKKGQGDKILLDKYDKGFQAMWDHLGVILSKQNQNLEEISNMMDLDEYVTNLTHDLVL
jgi:predicted dehydrogenase/threonine dehydrogenase-like Zn-dependent dehydrogenase